MSLLSPGRGDTEWLAGLGARVVKSDSVVVRWLARDSCKKLQLRSFIEGRCEHERIRKNK